MELPTRLVALVCFASTLCLAGSWPGYLVDSKCYDAEERNVNPGSTLMDVNRDRNFEIRYCTANAKTKAFAIVPQEGAMSLKLDSAGNAKAAELIRQTGRKSFFLVTVTGELVRNVVNVESISPVK
jgi:hypothetical protein